MDVTSRISSDGSFPESSQSVVTPYKDAISGIFSMSGTEFPLSQELIACVVMSSLSATCFCVRPKFFLASTKRNPNVFIVIPSFLCSYTIAFYAALSYQTVLYCQSCHIK